MNDAVEPRRNRGLRRLAWLAAAALLAFLAWRTLSLSMADHFASKDPGRALAWRPDHPEALFRQAERLAADPAHAVEAGEFARRSLRADPLDGRPYRVLGQLADANGDRKQAARHFALATARSPRDLISQAWLLDYHLAAGEAEPAMQRMDVLLRINPGLMVGLMPVLVAMATAPEAQGAMIATLREAPPWRTAVLVRLSKDPADGSAMAPVFEALRTSPGGLAPAELSAWLDRLTRDGHWGQAYLVWASQLPPESQRSLGNVFNGGFETEPGEGGFDWRFDRVSGARINRVAGEGVTGEFALRVAFEDRRVRFRHVRQMLALPAGRYRLQGRARPDNLRSERGLVWTVACADGRLLGESPSLRGNGPWRDFSAEFEIPVEGCSGQWLTLVLPARIPAEQRIGGRAWFDDMRILRVPAGPPTPAGS